MKISVVIPVLNEEALIGELVSGLRGCEVIVADGGSEDATVERAREGGALVVSAARGRGRQLHAGARAATGDVLWFVHADTRLPAGAVEAIERALGDGGVTSGTFRLEFEGGHWAARWMSAIYGLLQRIGLLYGDASIFVRRDTYEEAGGFRPMALFEDADLIRRLRQGGGFVRLDPVLTASARRFEGGVLRFARAWGVWIALQTLFWLGVSPELLARWYRPAR